MKDSIFLVFDSAGVRKMVKSVPSLYAGQYACRLDVQVDDKYFKRIIPIAKMELDDKFLIEPKIVLEPAEVEDEIVLEEEDGPYENN